MQIPWFELIIGAQLVLLYLERREIKKSNSILRDRANMWEEVSEKQEKLIERQEQRIRELEDNLDSYV